MKNKPSINELITAFADGELYGSELEYFKREMEKDSAIKVILESELRLKDAIKTKYIKKSAPESLKKKVAQIVENEAKIIPIDSVQRLKPAEKSPSKPKYQSKSRPWILVAALIVISILIYTNRTTTAEAENIHNTVEFISYQHFMNHNGSLLQPTIDVHNTGYAQLYLKENYNCNITVPELEGAEFAGIVYGDFHNDYKTPLLSYKAGDNDYIYVFAFELHDLNKIEGITRHQKAVEAIIQHNDVYTVDISGTHVLSWKWNDVWYSAVSRHHGDVIAAMLPH